MNLKRKITITGIYNLCIAVFLLLMMNTFLLVRKENILQSHTSKQHKNGKDLLLEALDNYKAYACKETLPYSRHQFNVSFIICFKDPAVDPMLSTYFLANGYMAMKGFAESNNTGTSLRFEEHLINVWLTLLHNYPKAVVLDIGSNIGAYTLASRAMDNPVISVDMDPHNQALLFNSLVLSELSDDNIQLLNPISDGNYEYSKTNRHGTLMDPSDKSNEELSESLNLDLTSITILDIFDNLYTDRDTFLIKLDIQGFECKVLKQFLEMEAKPKFVPYIQMEMIMHCEKDNKYSNFGYASPCVKTFHTEFLPLLERNGYIPHVPWPISFQEMSKVCYYDVLFVHKDAKPFPYWDENLSKNSFLVNFQRDTLEENI